MSGGAPSSPRTPQRKYFSTINDSSPAFAGSPGCSSTPSQQNGSGSCRKVLCEKHSPSKRSPLLSSPISRHSLHSRDSSKMSQSSHRDGEAETSSSFSKTVCSTDPSWSVKTFSSTEGNGTVKVEFDFPHGGWDDESSDENSCNLEIVEAEVETNTSVRRGRKRKKSEVSEEDNAILSGMGEEIERQLEAKAERNRLTVPNVKNILRSVITNPYVQAMVRRSIKSGDVAVSGDVDDLSFEPRMTRAKAKLLSDSNESKTSDLSWTSTPQKQTSASEYQSLIGVDLNDDSEDDEEYQPCEEEPSDTEHSEREGSERGSERDISIEQSPACDADIDSCPSTPIFSPRPNITDSATQTNWSEDGVFKVPLAPLELQAEPKTEENIALRTRSKLPLNDTPLEEIEQAFIPPDITPDLYDTTCDNADWQEFLKEFMQPMRSEPEIQNHDDDEEDPEYNVLAEEEIIDKEELRMDRAVKVSKRELNELMRELIEFTENMSSDDEEKNPDKTKSSNTASLGFTSSTSGMGSADDVSLFLDAYMSLGNLTPLPGTKTTPPPSRSPNTPTLHTPVPPISPLETRTPGKGKKGFWSESDAKNSSNTSETLSLTGKVPTCSKKQRTLPSPEKHGTLNGWQSGKKQHTPTAVGKPDGYFGSPSVKKQGRKPARGKLESSSSCGSRSGKKLSTPVSSGKPDSFILTSSDAALNSFCTEENPGGYKVVPNGVNETELSNSQNNLGLIGLNIAVPVTEGAMLQRSSLSPTKDYFLLTCDTSWNKDDKADYSFHPSMLDDRASCETISAPVDEASHAEKFDQSNESAVVEIQAQEDSSDPELSISLQMSNSPMTTDNMEELVTGDICLSSDGNVMMDNQILLSATQRLVLDQQMRQHVQFLTQHFLQTYQHPALSDYSVKCKTLLVSLESMGSNKQNSAFKATNLKPSLELITEWEGKFHSEEGRDVVSFMEQQFSKWKHLRKRKQKYDGSFSPHLMNVMANSTAFMYPQLLPPVPFKPCDAKAVMMLPSEEQLLVIGLEEFIAYIKEHNPKVKTCLKWALELVCQYLLVGKAPAMLHCHMRKFKKTHEPIKYFYEKNCAPPTSHFIVTFNDHNNVQLRSRPHHLLPEIWRNFLYPCKK